MPGSEVDWRSILWFLIPTFIITWGIAIYLIRVRGMSLAGVPQQQAQLGGRPGPPRLVAERLRRDVVLDRNPVLVLWGAEPDHHHRARHIAHHRSFHQWGIGSEAGREGSYRQLGLSRNLREPRIQLAAFERIERCLGKSVGIAQHGSGHGTQEEESR